MLERSYTKTWLGIAALGLLAACGNVDSATDAGREIDEATAAADAAAREAAASTEAALDKAGTAARDVAREAASDTREGAAELGAAARDAASTARAKVDAGVDTVQQRLEANTGSDGDVSRNPPTGDIVGNPATER